MKLDAITFVDGVRGGDDWTEDQKKTDAHQALPDDVAAACAANTLGDGTDPAAPERLRQINDQQRSEASGYPARPNAFRTPSPGVHGPARQPQP